MDILRNVSSGRDVSRRRVELHLAFRCRAVLDRQPLLVLGHEIVGWYRGADLRTDPLRGIGRVPQKELRDQRSVQNTRRSDGTTLRVGRVEIKRIGTEQRTGCHPPASLRPSEVGKLVDFLDGGKHIGVGGVVAQLGERNITQQCLPIYLDRLAAALRTCQGRRRRYPDLSGTYATETDG